MKFDEVQLELLKRRYLAPNETPEQMFDRVANYVKVGNGKRLMAENRFLPNSPTLMNAGRELGQMSACFVLPIEDSMESIFGSLWHTAMIHKSGGGTGFSFSRLRPKGDKVKSTGGVASGPISFMRVYDVGTDTVKQGGMRRGANMGVLRVDHPDIVEFIKCKHVDGVISNFNISVAITDEFMRAVEQDASFDLINPRNNEVWETVRAKDIWDLIIEQSWYNGEPGVLFIDTINRNRAMPELGEMEATNPCGEQPLLPYESCNLGSINLSEHVLPGGEVHYDLLADTVTNAVEFLNGVIDCNNFPLPEIAEMTKKTRKIGLGVMGWADMLIKLSIKYDSDEALKLADQLGGFIQQVGKQASAGRNATVTTIAPTGSISILAGCSSGIEPIFAVSEKRHQADIEYTRYHPLWGKYDEELFRTAGQIHWVWHVEHQAIWQKHVDNAISKTINLPGGATKRDVEDAVWHAYRMGCKGLTVYRDKSRKNQVIVEECEKCVI
ncbi:MAG: adenosylcobalamin-dependent ribonucleoside-diphosphate reductase [bacterium]|nr:adenosylcobalamin-dependent ribonucleoside-diphosphate reductase [bacterium]